MTVVVVSTPARPTAVVATGTTWAEFPGLWKTLLDQVYEFLRTSDVAQTGHNVMLYKDDVPNVEVGVEVSSTFAAAGRVVPSELPAGEAAMTTHRGPYTGLGDAHRAVLEWCSAHGRSTTGQRWEIYGDWREDPTELETEVYYQLG